MGVNEAKRRRTRQKIATAAMGLFFEQGFDEVTVMQIAEAASVSEKTVFNHFPSKAHLVFDEDTSVLDGLVSAIRHRAPGESALTAVRPALAALAGHIGGDHPLEAQQAFLRMVNASPTLQNHQRAMAAHYENALAQVLAEQTGAPAGSAEPFIVAVALVGALRAGFDAAAGSGGVAQAMDRALDLLEGGLAGYAVAPD